MFVGCKGHVSKCPWKNNYFLAIFYGFMCAVYKKNELIDLVRNHSVLYFSYLCVY